MIGNAKIALLSEDLNITEKVVQHMQAVGLTVDNVIENPTEVYRIGSDVPTIVLLVEPTGSVTLEDLCNALREGNRQVAIILLLKNINFSVMRDAVKIGVVDVLRLPDEITMLEKAVRDGLRSLNKDQRKHTQSKSGLSSSGGKVISFYSVKGGCGKTFLAANVAQAIRLSTDKRVLLIDLCLQFGGVQRMLNLQGQRSIADLDPVIHELDESHINNILFTLEHSGLNVLLGPAKPDIAELLTDHHIELLLSACRRYFDYIILDLPAELNKVSITALNESDQIIYIVTPDSPALFGLKAAMDFFERYGLIEGDKFKILVNKVSKKSDLTTKDIEKITGIPILAGIRSDYKAIKNAVNTGKPLLEKPKERVWNGVAKDVVKLSKQLVG
ncbi:AAA family ATPase [Thermincola potens]|uniref:AAA domain-containing protein n=1 Tax=Thermincola potens (strain JR) TaxID=635013 RepID=D5XAG9_THEPJ|nr:AAA family ATPase [Thermincola potens]ADG81268.1 conserved hypothetical protein [Thermincola potens JR]